MLTLSLRRLPTNMVRLGIGGGVSLYFGTLWLILNLNSLFTIYCSTVYILINTFLIFACQNCFLSEKITQLKLAMEKKVS